MPAPQIRSTILALYKLVCMYMYVCMLLLQPIVSAVVSADIIVLLSIFSDLYIMFYLFLSVLCSGDK